MITTDFWRENFIDELEPIEKLLFLYLLCNPATNLCGIYQLPLRIISSDTGISTESLKDIFSKFSSKERAYYLDGWVILPNAPKNQDLNNIKIRSGITRELEEVNQDLLIKVKELGIPYRYPIDTLSESELGLVRVKSKLKLGESMREDFEKFWSEYPKKVARKEAEKAFSRVKVELSVVLSGLDKWKKSEQWTKDDGQFVPHPTTWLNQERWNDEVEKTKESKIIVNKF